MSYYSRKHYSSSSDSSWLSIILALGLVILLTFGTNACSASTWNDGVCPDCETRYELRGVSRGYKYYSCPECGQEVQRYQAIKSQFDWQ